MPFSIAILPIFSGVTPRTLVQFLKLDNNLGVIITEIEPNSSGYRAGLIIGDIILEVDSKKVINNYQFFIIDFI